MPYLPIYLVLLTGTYAANNSFGLVSIAAIY